MLRRLTAIFLLIIVALFAFLPGNHNAQTLPAGGAGTPENNAVREGEILLKFRQDATGDAIDAVLARHQMTIVNRFASIRRMPPGGISVPWGTNKLLV